jgi:predicted amidohydrolase
MDSLRVGAIQLPTLGVQDSKLGFYIKNAYKKGVDLILFGEYVLNHFFKELETIPKQMVQKQTQNHIEFLKEQSREYNIIFIAPVVYIDKSGKYFKRVVKISPKSTSYYQQQILISYPHWNEKSFFSNPTAPLKPPMVFRLNGFKIMVLFGFELHFGTFWEYVLKNKIDLVLLPTASTFSSQSRWREIIKTKAFLNGCYILRANRLGEFNDSSSNIKWKFYGDTLLVEPTGEIISELEDRESMLIETLNKEIIREHRLEWGFEREIRLRAKKSKKYIKNKI